MFEYKLVSLKKCHKPEISIESMCYHYVIANDFNEINGYRMGDRKDIEDHIKEVLSQLNRKLKDTPQRMMRPVYKATDSSSPF